MTYAIDKTDLGVSEDPILFEGSVEINDGGLVAEVEPIAGYVNELEKVFVVRPPGIQRVTGFNSSVPSTEFPDVFASLAVEWGDWAIIGFTAGVEVQWKLKMDCQMGLNGDRFFSFSDGTLFSSAVVFTFMGQDYPTFQGTPDQDWSGTITVEPKIYWEYRRASGINPVYNNLTAEQLITDSVELNIQ